MSDLIENLCHDLKPVKQACCSWRIAAVFILAITVYQIMVVAVFGVRHNIEEALSSQIYLFDIGIALFIGILSAFATAFLRIPAMMNKGWMIGGVILIQTVFFLWIATRVIAEGFVLKEAFFYRECLLQSVMLMTAPLALTILFIKRGCTTHPLLTAYMLSSSVVFFSWAALRFTCPLDFVSHVMLVHFVPLVIMGAAVVFGARRIFSW